MQIRKAQIRDIDEIFELGKNVTAFTTSKEVVNFWPKPILKSVIKSDKNWIFVACEKKKIIGFIIVNYNEVFKKALIENIFVNLQFRKLGVGKLLLDTVLEVLKKNNCKYICALTEINCPAVKFYLNNGFNKGRSFQWLDKVIGKEFEE